MSIGCFTVWQLFSAYIAQLLFVFKLVSTIKTNLWQTSEKQKFFSNSLFSSLFMIFSTLHLSQDMFINEMRGLIEHTWTTMAWVKVSVLICQCSILLYPSTNLMSAFSFSEQDVHYTKRNRHKMKSYQLPFIFATLKSMH